MRNVVPIVIGLAAVGGLTWFLFFRKEASAAVAPPPPRPVGGACRAFDACVKANTVRGVNAGLATAGAAVMCGKHLTDACQQEQIVKAASPTLRQFHAAAKQYL